MLALNIAVPRVLCRRGHGLARDADRPVVRDVIGALVNLDLCLRGIKGSIERVGHHNGLRLVGLHHKGEGLLDVELRDLTALLDLRRGILHRIGPLWVGMHDRVEAHGR